MSESFELHAWQVHLETAVPSQVLLSLLQIHSAQDRMAAALGQVFTCSIILVTVAILETSNRSRAALLMDSELMVESFRKILRGVCDGEVMLDEQLNITGPSPCLKPLLMNVARMKTLQV